MRCIVASSGVLTIHNNNLAIEGENGGGGGSIESGGVFGSGGIAKSEKNGSCGTIKNEKATNLSIEDLLLAFNLVVDFFLTITKVLLLWVQTKKMRRCKSFNISLQMLQNLK
jgi:hypothetical protein